MIIKNTLSETCDESGYCKLCAHWYCPVLHKPRNRWSLRSLLLTGLFIAVSIASLVLCCSCKSAKLQAPKSSAHCLIIKNYV